MVKIIIFISVSPEGTLWFLLSRRFYKRKLLYQHYDNTQLNKVLNQFNCPLWKWVMLQQFPLGTAKARLIYHMKQTLVDVLWVSLTLPVCPQYHVFGLSSRLVLHPCLWLVLHPFGFGLSSTHVFGLSLWLVLHPCPRFSSGSGQRLDAVYLATPTARLAAAGGDSHSDVSVRGLALSALDCCPAGDAGCSYSAGAVGRREPRNVFPPTGRPASSPQQGTECDYRR